MKTAVEWLVDEHFGGIDNCTPDFKNNIFQAMDMEENIATEYAEHRIKFNSLGTPHLSFDEWKRWIGKP